MKLKTKILILMGGLMLLVFALNLGVASADFPHDEGGGIETAAGCIDYAGAGDIGVLDHALPELSPARAANGGPVSGALVGRNPLCVAHPNP